MDPPPGAKGPGPGPSAGGDRFPLTRHSILQDVRSGDESSRRDALEVLAGSYWKPVYKYIRTRWRSPADDAQDLTQGFFADVLERGALARFDPAKARFRTYLRACLDHYVDNERRAQKRLKRGGGFEIVSLDYESAEREIAAAPDPAHDNPDAYFEREWIRHLMAGAVEELRARLVASGKKDVYALFHSYDIDGPQQPTPPTYADLAARHGMDVTQVTNRLHSARKQFREIVLARLRAVTGSEEEFRTEARDLLGIDPRA
jgi:RNA polymerase sigma factor (sigma-70 family)